MTAAIYLMNSHRWLHKALIDGAGSAEGWRWARSPLEADIVIYLEPPWSDLGAPEPLRSLPLRSLHKVFVYSQADEPIPWAPGLYASLPSTEAYRLAQTGGFYVPHHHRERDGLGEVLERRTMEDPELLWSFVGTTRNASVRYRVAALDDDRGLAVDTERFTDVVRWGWRTEWRDEAQAAFRFYAETIARSKFVVCPRGRGLGSMRLFEALQVGRCPVLIADQWLPPPFVDWEQCMIKVAEADVERIPAILREREDDAATLGVNARKAWDGYFSPENSLRTIVNACIDIAATLTAPMRNRLAIATLSPFRPVAARRLSRHARHAVPRPR